MTQPDFRSCALTSLALLAALGTAQAQTPASTPEPQERPSLPPPVETPPQPPTGGVNLDAPRSNAPRRPQEPVTAAEQRQQTPPAKRGIVVLENAKDSHVREIDGVLVLTGEVAITYDGYRVLCDRATYDRKAKRLTFEGDVRLITADQTIYAELVNINVDTNEFFTRDGRAVVAPEKVGPQVIQPIRVSGSTLSRTGKNFQATEGFFTTCDFPNPHYKIGFRQMDLIPNNRIVLRDAIIYRYDKPVFRIKYLVIPIREGIAQFSYLPYVGRTQEEGWFVKLAIGYSLFRLIPGEQAAERTKPGQVPVDNFPGIFRLDLMEKKGIGFGIDQAYTFGSRSAGVATIYSLNDKNRGVNNMNGRLNHQQAIGDFLATINSDFQNNSYQSLSSNSKTGTTTVTLARSTQQRTTNLTTTQTRSDFGTSQSEGLNYTLTETEQIRGNGAFRDGTVTFRLNGTDTTNKTGGTVSGRREQSSDVEARGKLRFGGRWDFDAEARANRVLLADQKGGFGGAAFSGTQRLPDIVLTTDSRRLGILKYLPTRFQFGYGRFLENVSTFSGTTTTTRAVLTNRYLFNADVDQHRTEIGKRGWLTLDYSGSFRQIYYRNDAAQYILRGNGTLTQKVNSSTNVALGYNYLRPYGGSPEEFRLDLSGSQNTTTAALNVRSYRTQLSLTTGYDLLRAWTDVPVGIKRNPWQNAAMQLAFRPNDVLQTRFTASYDINSGRLLALDNRSRIRGRQNFALDTSVRYDPNAKKIAQVTEVATIPIFSRDLTLYALSGYNGLTKRFDYQQLSLVQSFHDYELVFGYIDQPFGLRRERGINFAIRLKAFPSIRPTTGSQYGTPLDTGTGEIF